MYMSYCRFEGTRQELQACMEDVREHVDQDAEYTVSDNEVRNFRKMVEEFVDFLQDMELLDEEGYIDDDRLADICESMSSNGKRG